MVAITLNIYTYCLQDGYFYLNLRKNGDAIHENFQNARCTPIKCFVEENLDSWHPKTHGPRNFLQSFYLADLIHKCREKYISIC